MSHKCLFVFILRISQTETCFVQRFLKGFLEGNIPLQTGKYGIIPLPVIDNVLNYKIEENDVFVIAIANPVVKEQIAQIMIAHNAEFIKLIHNTAIISPSANIGMDFIACPYVMVSCNTVIQDHVMFNAYSSLGHDSIVGAYSSIMGHVDITGNAKVGTHTFWGSGARALPCAKIGNHALVGAGSVVLKKVKSNTTVFGNPAMEI